MKAKRFARVLVAGVTASVVYSSIPAIAAPGDCGQPQTDGLTPTATDALAILIVAVGLGACDPCVCDVNNDGTVTATDALTVLSFAIGGPAVLSCPSCTTTTTLPDSGPGMPLAAGKKWIYEFHRTVTLVGPFIGVKTTDFVGEVLLHVDGATPWQGRQAWRLTRYELETVPAGDDAFGARVEYLFQNADGLEKWDNGLSVWKRILSTQMNAFGGNTLLLTREPNSDSTTIQSVSDISVPAGTFTAVRAHATYREGFTNNAPVDHDENHSEYYSGAIGLIKSIWAFDFDDNDPGAVDVFEDGMAELTAIDSGSSFPDVVAESESNDTSATAQTLAGRYSIVSGTIHIDDGGETVTDPEVFGNANGQKLLQDWYRFEHSGGSFRLDLVYQLITNGMLNDLDVYLFRTEPGGARTYVDRSTNDPAVDGERESIVSLSLAAGSYVIAVQAWNTPTEGVEYWYVIR